MATSRFQQTIFLLVLALLGGSWIVYSRAPVSNRDNIDLPEAPMVGHLAPDFTLESPTGQTYQLLDYVDREGDNGRPVVLNYWASWCGPCRIETPHFQRVHLKYGNQVAILGINQGETAQQVTEFGISYGLTYPLLVDQDNTVNFRYGILNLPTTVFIDRQGVIQEMYLGVISQAVLEERINNLLQ